MKLGVVGNRKSVVQTGKVAENEVRVSRSQAI
jgi:hypothetical protein